MYQRRPQIISFPGKTGENSNPLPTDNELKQELDRLMQRTEQEGGVPKDWKYVAAPGEEHFPTIFPPRLKNK